ncbi:ArgS-related anticodon-binding protein NrtL [Streptomyces wuyuanensis]|uniref:ArgS-related anticodon-binding protein NrtL n=1 Tax=Streptomyces wuyuanensis TaxID=1196353 RepID=UPI0037119C9D
MTPADLSRTVLGAVRRAVEEGALRGPVPERVKVERSRPGGSGDYATNAALRLAREARMPAREVAEVLSGALARHPGIAGVEITGPGFLNITLAADTRHALVREVLSRGIRYGHGDGMAGQVHQYHHRPDVRAAVTADAVRRLLRAQGAVVRTSCDRAEPAWAPLGATPDALGTPPVTLTELQPVPVDVPADELLRRFGPDATRWALLRPAGHDRPRPDDGLLVQNEGNPLFRVRYAHARSRALLRNAADLGFTTGPAAHEEAAAYEEGAAHEEAAAYGEGAYAGPADAAASALLTALGDHPAALESAARLRAPDRVARHLEATADALLGFQHTVLPKGDEKPSATHRSRLALAEAAGTVLAGGLALLGISAPEHL